MPRTPGNLPGVRAIWSTGFSLILFASLAFSFVCLLFSFVSLRVNAFSFLVPRSKNGNGGQTAGGSDRRQQGHRLRDLPSTCAQGIAGSADQPRPREGPGGSEKAGEGRTRRLAPPARCHRPGQ